MIATAVAAQTAARIRAMGDAIVALADALAHAEQVQYDAPPAPVAAQNDRKAPTGGVRRPTEETATDTRRLRVRAAVISGEIAADEITAKATAAAAELRDAVTEWGGLRA